MVETTVNTYGKLNILYNNAAISSEWVSIPEWSELNFNSVIDVNLKGTWLGMKYAIPEMIKSGNGSIINVTSTAADQAQRGSGIYAASKGGVASISRVAAVEFADKNVRVNCIKPGVIRSPMAMNWLEGNPKEIQRIEKAIPQGRLGNPEEVAQVALFLASDEASHVTGQTLAVDGGIESDSRI
jgi:NAD(P)-dependent dehydrogenase (short-subunit alcohol dehydrogenase family)